MIHHRWCSYFGSSLRFLPIRNFFFRTAAMESPPFFLWNELYTNYTINFISFDLLNICEFIEHNAQTQRNLISILSMARTIRTIFFFFIGLLVDNKNQNVQLRLVREKIRSFFVSFSFEDYFIQFVIVCRWTLNMSYARFEYLRIRRKNQQKKTNCEQVDKWMEKKNFNKSCFSVSFKAWMKIWFFLSFARSHFSIYNVKYMIFTLWIVNICFFWLPSFTVFLLDEFCATEWKPENCVFFLTLMYYVCNKNLANANWTS